MEGFSDHRAVAAVPIGTNGVPAIVNAEVTKLEGVDAMVMNDLADEEDDGPEDEASGDDYKEEEQRDSVVVRRGRGTKRVSWIAKNSHSK